MTIWFTSDLHLGHVGIIEHANRPFVDVAEMDETIIANILAVVKPGDMVYCLGDFSFYRLPKTREILQRLRDARAGQWVMVLGNHDSWADKGNLDLPSNVIKVCDYHEIRVNGTKVVLSHYPFATWNQSHRGSYMLHGHHHGSPVPGDDQQPRRLDVGVDCWRFQPVPFDTVDKLLSSRPSTGHHSY